MTIRDELLLIKGDNELLTAQEVVSWARAHPKSLLHRDPRFCGWDLKRSAYEHWIQAARQLIAIHIVYDDGLRKFVSLSIDREREGGGYRDVDDVLRDQALYDIMMADALRELERIEARYAQLKQLKPIWREVAKVRSRKKRGKAREEKRGRPELRA